MNNITKCSASTRINGDKENGEFVNEKVTTNITFDWSDVTVDELRALAQPALIIRKQAEYRNDGTIPTNDDVRVRDMIDHKRERKARDPLAIAMSLPDDERAALVEQLQRSLKK